MTAKTRSSRDWAFVDSSALIKRYVDESGRREVVDVLRRHQVVASAVLALELRSAVRRRISEGTLGAADGARILEMVAAERVYWTLVGVGADILAAAEPLISSYSLKTLDAIHLGSARWFAERMGIGQLLFVSADRRQTDAAAAMGLTVQSIG
jgi:predicted nucleic acid-binding protein